MFSEKELKTLRNLYDTIGRVLDGKPEEYDEEWLDFILCKLED